MSDHYKLRVTVGKVDIELENDCNNLLAYYPERVLELISTAVKANHELEVPKLIPGNSPTTGVSK